MKCVSVIRLALCIAICASFSARAAAQANRTDDRELSPPRAVSIAKTPTPSASPSPNSAKWDVDVSVKHLQENLRHESGGDCAAFTRKAIEAGAGGAKIQRPSPDNTGQVLAKDFGPSLVQFGFKEYSSNSITPDKFKKGDVVVIQAAKGHSAGHMAMYDGKKWISDFEQRDHWGGPIRDAKPSYKVYRFESAPAPTSGQSTLSGSATKGNLGGVLINPKPQRDDSTTGTGDSRKILRDRPAAKARSWRIQLPKEGDEE